MYLRFPVAVDVDLKNLLLLLRDKASHGNQTGLGFGAKNFSSQVNSVNFAPVSYSIIYFLFPHFIITFPSFIQAKF